MGLKQFLPQNFRYILLAVILLLVAVVRGSQFFFSRKKELTHLAPGTQRNYGIYGGAICPNCHRPFSLGIMPVKIGLGTRLARCEFCGKWSFVRRASIEELRVAEAAELEDAKAGQKINGKTEEEKLHDLLDESRFSDKD